MSISILGAGNVGMALAKALTQRGETVIFGVPEPEKYTAAVAALGPLAQVQSNGAAIAASELIILAIPANAVAAVAQSVPDWQGKILVDATNPLAPGLAGLTIGTHTSGAEELAKLAKGARVIKAFNTTGAENMADSHYPHGLPWMPVCGDDAEARQRVLALATQLGFDAVDCGDLQAARYLEPFAMTWIHLALKLGQGRNFAFARLQR
ncbi:NADPH-dependent F420 reductase [Chitinibacter sp. ZOR0017]|uniref:NADPH-dependent F420 reductase n=1 Tax=Chitinibacter sp. ZOR0017 TaxID=1339254 RepID=UPI00064692B1|nr:NADPH-dependent F420 reductase [Chitinibacter sp. ZOR0017]